MGDALISRVLKDCNIDISQTTGTSTTSVMSQNACTDKFAAKSHSHSASDLTSGTLTVSSGGTGATTLTSGAILLGNGTGAIKTTSTLAISKGGTGATSASSALSNLGITISSGTWTPTLAARNGTNPTYSILYKYARYYRINDLVYVTFHMKVNISNAGTDYACIRGLPFASTNAMNGQALALHETFGGIDQRPVTANIADSSSMIYLQNSSGECSVKWQTGDTWIGFSGCYIKA